MMSTIKTDVPATSTADDLAQLDAAYQERLQVAVRPMVRGRGRQPLTQWLSGLSVDPVPPLPAVDDDPELLRLTAELDALSAWLNALDTEQQTRQRQVAALTDPGHRMTARREIVRIAEQADELRPQVREITTARCARRATLTAMRRTVVDQAVAQLADVTAQALDILIEAAQAAQTLGRATGRQPGQGPALSIPTRPKLYRAYRDAIRRRYPQAGK